MFQLFNLAESCSFRVFSREFSVQGSEKSVQLRIRFEGKNFKDGYYLPFTFDAEDFINCRRHFRASEKRAYADFKEPLPPEERYTGRFFKHDFVFEQVKTEDSVEVEVPWYEDISTWEKLKKWLSSENKLDKPAEFLLSYNEWNPIGEELETEE